ncbi:MAG: DCC1-like thiol-disulfide oxidoreductase family protein [Gemmatimonadaceae bacterium]|nr:DCC1-like thiol-disulfide oxidoreductase family protein [Gemmatimonadaceae bacterium]
MSSSPPLLLYDGHCPLCARAVRGVLAANRARRWTFAPLGSAAAQSVRAVLRSVDSVVAVVDGAVYAESDAIIAVARTLPLPWRLLAGGAVLPRAWRDGLYRAVATRRRRWFPPTACDVPPAAARHRFLD